MQLRPPEEREQSLRAIAEVARGDDGLTRVSPFKLGTDRRAHAREQEKGQVQHPPSGRGQSGPDSGNAGAVEGARGRSSRGSAGEVPQ